jgi:hypothetical protein
LVAYLATGAALTAVVGGLLAATYSVALVTWFARDTTTPGTVNAPGPARRVGLAARLTLVVGGLLVLVVAGFMVGPGLAFLTASALAAVLVVLVRRREVRRPDVACGAVAGLVPAAATWLLGDGNLAWAITNLLVVPPLFVAGAVLMHATGVGRVRVLDGQYANAVRGFAVGCVFAVPMALFNLLGNLQANDQVRQWWQPAVAVAPAVTEEVWARLFVTTLCYAILLPVSARRPGVALSVAVLTGVLAHGFAHSGINPVGLLLGALVFMLPAALLFVRRDLEHAIGCHFMIDLVRYVAAFLG